jgi:hypothetical protein
MVGGNKVSKHTGIYRRAAEIRQLWSPRERARRLGLPPDLPARLRARLDGHLESSWPPTAAFHLVESQYRS